VICAEAGNVFNEYLLISVFLDGLQPFAAHYIRSRVRDDMTIAQVQQEEKDAGLVGRAVAASSRSLELPRTSPIRLPLAPRPRDTVATVDSDSYASSESPAYEVYWTPNTHRVVATTECVPRDAQEGTWEGGSDVSIPIRVWTSYAGLGQEEPVLAIGEHRSCYLCFSPDRFIGSCPQLTRSNVRSCNVIALRKCRMVRKPTGRRREIAPSGIFNGPMLRSPWGLPLDNMTEPPGMPLDILTLRDSLGPWIRQIVFTLTLVLPSDALCGMRPLVVEIGAWNLPERV
jgi:hypothetical protein